jgi:FAD:protein FMN transferase
VLDDSFPTMGTVARVVRDADGEVDVRSLLAEIDRRLSRFDASSDLSQLNADPRASVPAASLLRAAVAAALRAASLSDGLVDPTLLGALRRAGYGESRAHVALASLLRARHGGVLVHDDGAVEAVGRRRRVLAGAPTSS